MVPIELENTIRNGSIYQGMDVVQQRGEIIYHKNNNKVDRVLRTENEQYIETHLEIHAEEPFHMFEEGVDQPD